MQPTAKSIIWSIAVIILALSFFFVIRSFNNDSVLRKEIISYVNDNYEQLVSFPYSQIVEIQSSDDSSEVKEQKEKEVIQKHLGNRTIVKRVYAYDRNVLQFYCGGSGLLDTGKYMGFYFSPDDAPCAFEFNNLELIEIEPDVFEGMDEKGRNQEHNGHKIQTEKIRDYWYYYMQCWY